MKVNNGFSAACAGWAGAENRESGASPERYRHCKRGGTPHGESRSLEALSEKTVWVLWMREPGYLLRSCFRQTLQVRGFGGFWRRNTAAAACTGCRCFCVRCCDGPPSIRQIARRCADPLLRVSLPGERPSLPGISKLKVSENQPHRPHPAAAAFVMMVMKWKSIYPEF